MILRKNPNVLDGPTGLVAMGTFLLNKMMGTSMIHMIKKVMTSIQLAVFSSIGTAGSVHQHLTEHLIETVPIPPPPHTHPRLSRSPPPSSADPPPPPARARAPPRPRCRKPPPPLPALAAMTAPHVAGHIHDHLLSLARRRGRLPRPGAAPLSSPLARPPPLATLPLPQFPLLRPPPSSPFPSSLRSRSTVAGKGG